MKNHFEISVLKEGEELPKDCIVEDVEGSAGVKVMHGMSEDELPITAAFLFDKRKWNQETAEGWIEQNVAKLEPVKKSFTSEIKNFNDDNLTFDAVASTDSVDRDGDILRASGWQLKSFKKNPVLLYGHDARALPIGKVLSVEKGDGKLEFTAQMESITMRGHIVYEMFKGGFLNAFSVRFDPFEWKEREPPKEGAKKGERYGREYTKLDLLEISVVTIPANAEALISRDFQSLMVKNFQCENSMLEPDEAKRKEILESKVKICTGCGACKDELKPGFEETENEIRYRVREPGTFQEGSFRRITLQATKPRVYAIIGRPTGETTTKIQSVRFPKGDGWTMPQAKAWIKDHPEIKKDYTEEELKDMDVQPYIEEKSGRVLSAKNRTLVNSAIESIGVTSGALQALLEAAEPQAGLDTDNELSKLKEDLNKIGEEEDVERIIQDGDKILNEIEGGK